MSATNRGSIRVENDFYATPEWCTKALFKRVSWDKVDRAFEPCRGDGAIYNLLEKALHGSGEPGWAEIREGVDYLKADHLEVDFSPSNPPYSLATEFLKKALTHCRCVAYLLRLNFLESEERKEFFTANPPTHLYVLCKRPSFVDVCAGFPKTKDRERIKGCGNSFQKKDAVKICPSCGAPVKAGTDATGYAWYCWDRGGIMLDGPGIYFL